MAKFCSNCGHELQEGEKYCSECGTAVGASVKSGAEKRASNSDITTEGRTRCPNPSCPLPDDVQKVSIVYSSGAAQQFVGWSVTERSKTLAPPAQPERKEGPGSDEGCVAVGCMVVWGSVSVLGLVGLGGLLYRLFVLHATYNFTGNEWLLTWLGLPALILVPGLIFFVILKAYKEGDVSYEREIAAWRTLKARWEQLYYCNRCGSVFNPTEGGRFVPASRMKELLT